jgi:hypothetical protein
MNATMDEDEDEDDRWDAEDDAGPGDDWDDQPAVPCPYCRREILEDVSQCPYCKRYLSAEDHAGPGKPAWIIATALVCLGIAIWWMVTAF